MASIKQEQNLKLGQKLSPKQILFTRLLEVPSFQMEQRIQQELVDNPALEIAEYDEDDKSEKDIDQDMDDPLSDNDSDNQENDLIDSRFITKKLCQLKTGQRLTGSSAGKYITILVGIYHTASCCLDRIDLIGAHDHQEWFCGLNDHELIKHFCDSGFAEEIGSKLF